MREQRWVFGKGPKDDSTLAAIERALQRAAKGAWLLLTAFAMAARCALMIRHGMRAELEAQREDERRLLDSLRANRAAWLQEWRRANFRLLRGGRYD